MKKENKKKSQTISFGKCAIIIIIFVVIGILLMVLFGRNESNMIKKDEGSSQKIETGDSSKEDISQEGDNQEIEIPQQTEAEYEKWLAAAVIMGISIEYPEFEPGEIYSETSTALNDRESSKGIYVLFKNNGKNMAVHSMPIETERAEKGTIDLSAESLGFATFDLVDSQIIDTTNYQRIPIDEVGKLISEIMQFTLYHH